MTDQKQPAPGNQERRLTEADLVQLVRREAQRFLRTKGVTSVGVGYCVDKKTGNETSELCIQFTVEEKTGIESLEEKGLERLPDSIRDEHGNEVRVQVFERSYEPSVAILDQATRGTGFRRIRRNRQDPIRPGISVAHEHGTAGTLGAVVYDRQTRQPYILSNWHVLQGDSGGVGDAVLQPGPYDGGTRQRDSVGRLVRSHLGLAGDCAVSSINGRSYDASIVELDVVPPPVVGKAEVGDQVIKSGRTTGVTRGIVRRVGVVANIRFGAAGVRQIGCFEIRPDPGHPAKNGEISAGGDSGSVWLIFEGEHEHTVVGLHFAGETDPDPAAEHALACNIHSVFEKLDVTL